MRFARSSNRSETISRRAALSSLAFGACALSLRTSGVTTLGCQRAEPSGPDRQEVLRQTISIVMLPTLADLVEKTNALVSAASALRASPSAAAAEAMRSAWRAAHGTWERSETFAFGPAEDLAITGGAIDAWPAAGSKIDALIDGTATIDDASVGTISANMRGFPGTEHLLFDSAVSIDEVNRRLVDDARAPRRRDLLAAQCNDLAAKCRAVRDAWDGPTGYGHELAEAGHGSKQFGIQREAVDKILTGMLALAELVLVAKLAKPLGLDTGGALRPDLEEAPRSDTSLLSIEQNILGIQAVYECRFGDRRGVSFAEDVANVQPGADATFRQTVEGALAAVRAVDAPMRVLLAGDRAKLVSLHGAVQAMKRSINTDLASALGASIGFGYSDTD